MWWVELSVSLACLASFWQFAALLLHPSWNSVRISNIGSQERDFVFRPSQTPRTVAARCVVSNRWSVFFAQAQTQMQGNRKCWLVRLFQNLFSRTTNNSERNDINCLSKLAFMCAEQFGFERCFNDSSLYFIINLVCAMNILPVRIFHRQHNLWEFVFGLLQVADMSGWKMVNDWISTLLQMESSGRTRQPRAIWFCLWTPRTRDSISVSCQTSSALRSATKYIYSWEVSPLRIYEFFFVLLILCYSLSYRFEIFFYLCSYEFSVAKLFSLLTILSEFARI